MLSPAFTKFAGLEFPGPGLMSATRFVPVTVPSDEKSSLPPFVELSVATKMTLPLPTCRIEEGTTEV